MRVMVTGASGFIGSHICRALSGYGHEVIACVRNPESVWWSDDPAITTICMDFSKPLAAEDWLAHLRGVDVVINSVGIIHENRTQRFEQLHHIAPCVLFRACTRAGVKRVIQISALGADDRAVTRYHRTKKAADDCLRRLDLSKAIVRPSLVYGRGGASTALFKALAALPVQPLPGKGDQLVQPIHIDDLTRLILRLVDVDASMDVEIDAVGPAPITFKEMLETYRRWLGYRPSRFVSIPFPVMRMMAAAGGVLAEVPLSGEVVTMLQQGNTGDPRAFSRLLGSPPRSLATVLGESMADQGDRWHARLYFARVLLRYAVASLWIFTALTSAFIYPLEQSHELLARLGITGPMASWVVYGGALLDAGIGTAVLTRYRVRLVAHVQLVLVALYTLLISLGLPEFWFHPFGPISKNIPFMMAILILRILEQS